jgi:hypothetical protein
VNAPYGETSARWDENQTAPVSPFVPLSGKTQLIPSFELSWAFSLGRIVNGEKVLGELAATAAP